MRDISEKTGKYAVSPFTPWAGTVTIARWLNQAIMRVFLGVLTPVTVVRPFFVHQQVNQYQDDHYGGHIHDKNSLSPPLAHEDKVEAYFSLHSLLGG